jgi:hypothetical protein
MNAARQHSDTWLATGTVVPPGPRATVLDIRERCMHRSQRLKVRACMCARDSGTGRTRGVVVERRGVKRVLAWVLRIQSEMHAV